MSFQDIIGLIAALIVTGGGIIFWVIVVVQGLKKPESSQIKQVKWHCRRCGQDVDMKAFRCGCTQSPSPWEEVTP